MTSVLLLTRILHFNICERLEGVVIGDRVQIQAADSVVHLLGLGDELVGELLDFLGCQVPAQAVLCADTRLRAKHHFACRRR